MRLLNKRFFIALASGLGAVVLIVTLRFFSLLQAWELSYYDYLLKLQPYQPYDSPIVLIGETEADLHEFGYPIPDERLADALERLDSYGARVIGVDIYRDVPVPNHDAKSQAKTNHLDQALQRLDKVIWIYFIATTESDGIGLPAVLNDQGRGGFNDLNPDPDGVPRNWFLHLEDPQGEMQTSFPLLLAQKYLAEENIQLHYVTDKGFLQLGKVLFKPLEDNSGGYATLGIGGYQFMLRYPGLANKFSGAGACLINAKATSKNGLKEGPDGEKKECLNKSYPAYSLSDLLNDKIPKPKDVFAGKLVLIGGMALSLKDIFPLPDGKHVYGVELHAHVVDQLLKSAIKAYPNVEYWPDDGEYAWIFLWGLLGGLGSVWGGRWGRAVFFLASPLTIFPLLIWLLPAWWLPLLPAFMAWLAAFMVGVGCLYFLERVERRQLMRLFEGQVSPQVASVLWQSRQQFFAEGRVHPEQLTATVLFTDLAGFTSVAENMEPAVLMDWLNVYMEAMSALIIAEGGMINKYIGDAIMAVFGVPIAKDESGNADDAACAVKSALKMRERLVALNREWLEQGLPIIGMRVGIHTGPLVAGTLGGQQRTEYTVIGDTVNTAARLESFDKAIAPPTDENPCRILIGETTWGLINGQFATEKVGMYPLKGKQNNLFIYQVLDTHRL
jgi:adenylate cyclase